MRARGAAIQGGLALVGLTLAWTTWQREPEKAAGEAIVVDAGKADVVKVRYEDNTKDDAKKWVELESKKDDDGASAVWLHLSANATAKTPEREVRGNDGAEKLWAKFAPLRATRALGQLSAEKLKELGLAEPKKRLEVTTRSGKKTFSVGSSPFNVSDPYVMDDADKRVYVLGGGVLSDLDSAAVRLVDRTLHAFKQTEWDQVNVTSGGKTRELVQQGLEQPATAKLAGKKSGKPDDMAKNWHDKIQRTFVTDVLGKGEKPDGGDPAIVVKLEYFWKGKPKGFLEIGRVTPPAPANPPPGATSSQPPAPVLYGRTEHTAGWVKLPGSLEETVKEADKIAASAD
jgi:hypothetical protein